MNRIHILSESLCNKIAAGEVVERPASVVKELIENALDAGADEILVDVESGGKKMIRIQDNGCGMSRDDAFLSLERHATSKISSDDDLFRLTTLGFRGEALPSIAAVSRLDLKTRDAGSEAGWHIRADGGAVGMAEETGMPAGTTIEIRNLFFNTPARRKFLRQDQTEMGHVADVVSRQALARPEVRFRLNHNGRTVVDALRVERVEERVAAILGREAVRDMVSFSHDAGDLAIHGMLSRPHYNRSATSAIYTYINGRFIRDRVVQHALMEGYRNLLMKGRYPVVVLFLDLPPDMVDVNVHPTKHEVRFRDQSQVHGFIASSVRNALRLTTSRSAEPASETSAPGPGYSPPSSGPSPGFSSHDRQELLQRVQDVRQSAVSYPEARHEGVGGEVRDQAAPFGMPEKERPPGPAAQFAIIGQFRDSYILCQDGDDLVLIDQHAAHERVGFERLCAQFYGAGIEMQTLLFPVVIDFDHREAEQVRQRLGQFVELGFELESFGGKSFALKAVPQLLGDAEAERLVRDVASELAELGESGAIRDAYEHILATMACHSVVRARQKLSPAEMRSLLQAIDQVDFGAHCPHGRPVMQRIGLAEIEKLFKRT